MPDPKAKRSSKPAAKAIVAKAEPKADPKPAPMTESKPEPTSPAVEPAPATKPAAAKATGPDPNHLDRDQIASGVSAVRGLIRRCGAGFAGTSISVSVVVAPSGDVTSVTVNDSPDGWLSSCVSARMKGAKFAATPSGGAFRQPFTF